MERQSLVDQVVLVTGASGGIGRAVALELAAAGARLVLTGRRPKALRETMEAAAAVGLDEERGFVVAADLTEADAAASIVKTAVARFGRLDALVHCAGVGVFKSFHDISLGEIDEVLTANLVTAITATKAAMPALIESEGHVVHVGSGLARRAVKNATIYVAAKFGLRGFCEALRLDCARFNVRVSLVSPAGAGVDTPFWERADPNAKRESMMPPQRVAEAIAFVLSTPRGALVDEITLRTA